MPPQHTQQEARAHVQLLSRLVCTYLFIYITAGILNSPSPSNLKIVPGSLPDLKKDQSSFIMIFDALSNAAYRVSLRGPGAELEGAITDPPPIRC